MNLGEIFEKPVNKVVALFLFLVIGAGIYGNSLSNPFVYDDEIYVEGNRNIRSLGNSPLFFTNPRLITANPRQAGHYRPLVVTSYAVNYAIGGLNPYGYHLVNLGFHVGSAFLIFLIVSNFTSAFFAAIAAGLIFLVHPLNSEAVNYITARSSLMSGFFYLLAFYFWVRYRMAYEAGHKDRRYGLYIFSFLSFAAGMLSKEVVITIPIMLWLYDLYFKNIPHSALRTPHFVKWRTYIPYIPFILVVTVPYLLMRISSFGRIFPYSQRDTVLQIYTGVTVLAKYWLMLLFPYPLTPIHEIQIHKTVWSYQVIYSIVIITGLVIISLFIRRFFSFTWKYVSFFLLWFIVVLLPVAVISLNAVFQENRGYLAVVSFAVIAGLLLGRLSETTWKRGGYFMLILLVIVYSIVVVKRNTVWRSAVSLWEDTVQKSPGSPMSYTSLGVAYRRNGMNDKALNMFRKALQIGGEKNFIAHDSLGRIYKAAGRWDIAAAEFEKAIEADPNYPFTYIELGNAYSNLKKFELAEEQYNKAIKLDPEELRTYFNLGSLYSKMGRVDDTINAYQKALSMSPEDMYLDVRFKIGVVLEKLERRDDAAMYYRQILRYSVENDAPMIQEARRRLNRLEKQY